MNPQIEPLVRRWVTNQFLDPADKPALKARYIEEVGAKPDCTECANFWADVKQHFFFQFKQLDRDTYIMATTTKPSKYTIKGGKLMLPGDSMVYVNQGITSESVTVLTDEIAEKILADNPTYNTLIVLNPVWVELQAQLAAALEANPGREQGNADASAAGVEQSDNAELQALTSQYDELKTDHATITAEKTSLQTQLETETKAKDEALKRIETLRGELNATKGHNTRLTKERDELKKALDEAVKASSQTAPANTAN